MSVELEVGEMESGDAGDGEAFVDDPLVGSHIDRRYLIERVHGRGGMAVVYAGVQREIGLSVAIKVLDGVLSTDPEAVRLFLKEARTATLLSHPNIVAVCDVGTLPDGRPFLVMPMLSGSDLASMLLREGPQPPKRVAALLQGVGAALDLIHARGLVHRDIKSENLMHVRSNAGADNVIVLDFGIASARLPQMQKQQVDWCGTPEFMPPEALAGHPTDHRGDVYALATVAFELLTGCLPFDGGDLAELIHRKLYERPRPLSAVGSGSFPIALEQVLAHGLAADPELRPNSAGDFVRELRLAAEYAAEEAAQPRRAPSSVRRSTLVGPSGGFEPVVPEDEGPATGIRARRKTRVGMSDAAPAWIEQGSTDAQTQSAGARADDGAPAPGRKPSMEHRQAQLAAARERAAAAAKGHRPKLVAPSPAGPGASARAAESTKPAPKPAPKSALKPAQRPAFARRDAGHTASAPSARARAEAASTTLEAPSTVRAEATTHPMEPAAAPITRSLSSALATAEPSAAPPPAEAPAVASAPRAPALSAPPPMRDEPAAMSDERSVDWLSAPDAPAPDLSAGLGAGEEPDSIWPPPALDRGLDDDAFAPTFNSRKRSRRLVYLALSAAAIVGLVAWSRTSAPTSEPVSAALKAPVGQELKTTPVGSGVAAQPEASARIEPTSGTPPSAPTTPEKPVSAPAPAPTSDSSSALPTRNAPRQPALARATAEPAARVRPPMASPKLAMRAQRPVSSAASKPSRTRGDDSAPVLSIQPKDPAAETSRAAPAKAVTPPVSRAARAEALARDATDAMLRGDLQPAAALYDQALKADPSYAPAWRGKGLLLERGGQKREAANAFRAFLRLQPSGVAADAIERRLEALGESR